MLNQSGRDLYVVPEMEEENDHFSKNSIVVCKNDTSPPSTLNHFDVQIFQLMALMMLPGELDQCSSNLQRKGYRKMIQREWENRDEHVEVVPQLHRDNDIFPELLSLIELN